MAIKMEYDFNTGKLLEPGQEQSRFNIQTGEAIGSTIPTSTLQPQTAMEIPQAPETSTADTLVAGADEFTKNLEKQQAESDKAEKSVDALSNEISNLLGTTTGRGQAQLEAEDKLKIPEIKKELGNVNSQIRMRMAEFTKIQAKLDQMNTALYGEGMGRSELTGRQAQIQRQLMAEKNSFAADIGLLQAQASAIQGNLEMAQTTANRAVDLKYEDALSLIDVKFKQLGLLEGKLNREESKTAELLKQKYQQERDEMAIKVANEKDLNATLLNLMQSYPDARISLTDSIETANEKITANSRIYADKIRMLGSGGSGGSGSGAGYINPDTNEPMSKFDAGRSIAEANPNASDEELFLAIRENVPELSISDVNKIVAARPEKEATPLTPESVKTTIVNTLQTQKDFYNRSEAKTAAQTQLKAALGISKDGKLPKAYLDIIEDALVEVYGRTFWQKVLPGGR